MGVWDFFMKDDIRKCRDMVEESSDCSLSQASKGSQHIRRNHRNGTSALRVHLISIQRRLEDSPQHSGKNITNSSTFYGMGNYIGTFSCGMGCTNGERLFVALVFLNCIVIVRYKGTL